MYGVRIAGLGTAVPNWRITNAMIAQLLQDERERLRVLKVKVPADQEKEFETNDEWIQSRTGIRQRYFCPRDNSVATSDLAVEAAGNAWTDAYGEALDTFPEFIIIATVSPDHFTTPPTSVIVHRKLGVPKTQGGHVWPCVLADITLACTSFMVALQYGCMLIETGRCQRGLVIGADRMSTTMSWQRRSPFVILGDGAGALVLERTTAEGSFIQPNHWIVAGDGGKDGEMENLIKNWAGGSAQPLQPEHLRPLVEAHLMAMDGNPVFQTVGPLVTKTVIPAILERIELTLEDIDVLVLHQANQRITDFVAKGLQKSNPKTDIRIATLDNPDGTSVAPKPNGGHIVRIFCNIERYGNMTSASVPTALAEARDAGVIQPGSKVIISAFGGGLSWAAAFATWRE